MRTDLLAAVLLVLPGLAAAQAPPDARTLERVSVTGGRPSSLPIEIPTTTEGISGGQVERSINATDLADALKYLPSLVVRKRNIGDYDHAVLASRASGTGNSARSLVYADGMLLSNLLGNGAEFTPRWGLVSPDEIERIDVLYGPFSAAYPGNSAGAIVDVVTRMPQRFEAHMKLQGFSQRYQLYATDERYGGHQASASLGNRSGALSWWLSLNRLDAQGQPLVIVRAPVAAAASAAGTPVTGAVPGRDHFGYPVLNLGTGAQTDTRQDQARLKLAWDFTPTLHATCTFGVWHNEAERAVDSYLRDAAGNVVSSGTVNLDGRSHVLSFPEPSRGRFEHLAHGLAVKSNRRGVWDWELVASLYDYARDELRSDSRRVDQSGTGWNTLALKGVWRRPASAHVAEFGLQHDAFQLRRREAPAAAFRGDTTLTSLWLQDTWRFAPQFRAVLGGRMERWRAFGGSRSIGSVGTSYTEREEQSFSPKAAIAYQASAVWTLKASIGRAVRFPTVSELYQGGISTATGLPTLNDPNLKPEKSHTSELSLERELGDGHLRGTLFYEHTQDALYTQPSVGGNAVQNVERIRTNGVELAWQGRGVVWRGLDVSANLTYADSVITRNTVLPASVGKRQPRVPEWRAHLLAEHRFDTRWSGSVGARYSGPMFGQLDNSDINGMAYQGFSGYLMTDLRVQCRITAQWRASLGIDNLGNREYWAFHPYPQRTLHAELRWDL